MIDYDSLHRKRIRKYIIAIEKAFADLIAQTSSLAMRVKLKDELFQFRKHPYILKDIEKALSDYRTAVMDNILIGTSNEWEFANLKSDALKVALLEKVKDKVAPEILSGQYEKIAESPRNTEALKAFQERKKGKFNISERVWNIESGIKKELEFALDIALTEGKSAQQLAREIKQYLNYPDKLFRRVRDKHGNLVISKNAEVFNPGQGVYRSSHKNALRLAANEINIAYRESEQLRIAGNPDVVGIKISLSPQHSIIDICDQLAGTYPKDFQWSSWHTNCKCHRTTVLKSDDEFISELNQGLELPPESSKNFVKSPPKEFDKWISDNADKMKKWKKKPSFVTDNEKFVKK